MIGANVLVEGSKLATVTNINGEFSLEVPQNSKLRITYIGYATQEIAVKNKTLFNIQLLEDTKVKDNTTNDFNNLLDKMNKALGINPNAMQNPGTMSNTDILMMKRENM